MNTDSRLIVIANRRDGVGARMCAIMNAWSIARVLGQEFRFVWPRGADIWLREPGELFSDTFIDNFEITESEFAGRVVRHDLMGLSVPDARERSHTIDPMSMIKIVECFNVLAFANETAEVSKARFRAGLSEIGWGSASHALIELISNEKVLRGYSAIHVRAGDIVIGDWRQFVPIEKYTPMAYVEFAIETLSNADRSPVVVVSDNEPYVRHLKARFKMIRTPGDLVAGYADLTELQRAFADILVLSQARRIVGPRMSAFSQLAANLGNLTIQGAHELMAEHDAQSWLRDRIARARKEVERSAVLRPLLVRDICWFLDVFSDDLAFGNQVALARRAAGLEPNFCGALNRSAAALALVGSRRASKKASLRAQRAAAAADRHADPMVESLATFISANVVGFGTRRCSGQRALERLRLASIVRLFGSGVDRSVFLDDIERSLERCQTLVPKQTHHSDVLLNLRYQIAALAWLTAADDQLREIAKRMIRPADCEPLFLRAWRPSGFSKLRESGGFPHVLRNLEVVTIRIARAIGTALSSTPPSSALSFHVDGITTSPSGLRWVNGWAYDPDMGRSELAVAYHCQDAVVSGGVTFLPRPDVAEAQKEPRALKCGFAFPVTCAALPTTIQLIAEAGHGLAPA